MPVSLRSRSMVVKTEPEEETDAAPRAKRRAKTKVDIPEESEIKQEEIHSPPSRNVEEIRRKNLEDNKAFLEGLLMTKIRDDFKSLTNTLQPTVKKEGKKRDFKFVTVTENVSLRRSRRLANLDVDGNKLPTPEGSDDEAEGGTERQQVTVKRVYRRAPDITPEEQEAINEKIKQFFNQEEKSDDDKTVDYQFSDLNITDENVLKLTPDRLIAMDIHSRTDLLAVIGCDRRGTIGLIVKSIDDLHGSWAKINYDFHSEYATCCSFDRFQSHCIHSTSYDATLRSCDITKSLSTEVFKEQKNHGLTSFDYFSFQTLLVAEDNGDVLRMDMRAQLSFDRFDLSKKRIRTLHINPNHPEEFCISGTDSCVKVYDLRQMSNAKYILDTGCASYGAYFNIAGTHLMVTARDDHLLSFSCEDMAKASDPQAIAPSKKIYHRNYVNRFVTPFRAQPYAAFESYFLIGSNGNPRAITVLDENCKTISSLTSENLNSLATVNAAHRSLPIVVGGNSSGRIHVFTGQM